MASLLLHRAADSPDAIGVDWDEWPTLTVRWSAGRKSSEAIREFCDALRAAAGRDEPFKVLVDSRGAWPLTPSQLAAVLRTVTELQGRVQCTALALVTPSRVHRATLDSVRWRVVSSQRWGSFDDEEAARAWLDG